MLLQVEAAEDELLKDVDPRDHEGNGRRDPPGSPLRSLASWTRPAHRDEPDPHTGDHQARQGSFLNAGAPRPDGDHGRVPVELRQERRRVGLREPLARGLDRPVDSSL